MFPHLNGTRRVYDTVCGPFPCSGNFEGEKLYQTGSEACTSCPSERLYCVNNLCSCTTKHFFLSFTTECSLPNSLSLSHTHTHSLSLSLYSWVRSSSCRSLPAGCSADGSDWCSDALSHAGLGHIGILRDQSTLYRLGSISHRLSFRFSIFFVLS